MSTLAAEEQVINPLAGAAAGAPSPTSGGDEEDSSLMTGRSPSARPACYRCCGCAILGAAAAATVLLAVGFFLYVVREPIMTINAISFRLSDAAAAAPGLALRVVADVTVKNRNPVTFYFSSYQTAVYHRGALMARARGPGGRCGGRRSLRLNVTVDIPATGRLLSDGDLVREVASGTVTMDTSTAIAGHVMVLGLFRHRVELLMNCTAAVAVATQTITYQLCTESVEAQLLPRRRRERIS